MKSVLCAILMCVGCVCAASARTPGEVDIGGTLRDAKLQGLNGPDRKLSAFRGRPLIINVWASWCGPCRQEMASLERLAWRDEAAHFSMIGISTDDYKDRAQAFLRLSNATFNHFIDNDRELENMLGADRLPLTLLIDSQGRVLEKVYGAKEWDSPASVEAVRKAFRIPKAAAGK